MKNLKKPVFLKIGTVEQLNALIQSLDMSFDMVNDMALDDLITTTREVRELSVLSDSALADNLNARREDTDSRLDHLLSIHTLQQNLQMLIGKLPE